MVLVARADSTLVDESEILEPQVVQQQFVGSSYAATVGKRGKKVVKDYGDSQLFSTV